MNCTSNLPQSNFISYLEKVTNSENETMSCFLAITNQSGNIDSAFLKYFDIVTTGHDTSFDVNTENEKQLELMYRVVTEWRNYRAGNSNHTIESKTNNEVNTITYGYHSVDAREFAMHHIGNVILLTNYKNNKATEKEYFDSVRNYYLNLAISRIATLRSTEESPVTKKDIKQELVSLINNDTKKEGAKMIILQYINKNLANKSKQSKNLIALIRELYSDNSTIFSDVIFRDNRVNGIMKQINDEDREDTAIREELAKNSMYNPEGLNVDNITDFDKDTSLFEYDSHMGMYSTFMTHLTQDAKSYLSALVRLDEYNADGNHVENTDNELGVPNFIPLQETTKLIYSEAGIASYDRFIDKLKVLADTKPGMQALHKLVDDMRKDPDFGYRFHRCFAKSSINRVEVRKSSDYVEVAESNKTKSPLYTLTNNINNNARSVALYMDKEKLDEYFDDLDDFVEPGISKIVKSKHKDELISKLVRISKELLPNISEHDIKSYLRHKDNNVANFVSLLRNTYAEYEKAANSYINLQSKKSALRRNKKANKEALAQLDNVDFASNLWNNSVTIAETLNSYINVAVDLNHRNIYGNLSSDLINDSWFINILDKTSDVRALESMAKDFEQTTQADYSNLVTHYDEQGKIINQGLFVIGDDGHYKVDPDALTFLKGFLINGATNMDRRTNASYDKLSNGDYIASTFFSYFNPNNDKNDRKYGMFYMRTPSDASNNFAITMPSYDLGATSLGTSLLHVTNINQINKSISDIINNNILSQRVANPSAYDSIISGEDKSANTANMKSFVNRVTSNYRLNYDGISEKEKNEYTLSDVQFPRGSAITYLNNDAPAELKGKADGVYNLKLIDGTVVHYVLRGDIDTRSQGSAKLRHPQFLGFIEDVSSLESKDALISSIFSDIYSFLESKGKISKNLSVNTDHRIFKQIRNVFYQELLDHAEAVSAIFQTNIDGSVRFVDGKPQFNPGFDENSTLDSSPNLYENYHTGFDRKLFHRDERGDIQFGDGNVFHSTKFNVTDADGNTTSYGQQILDELFDSLYGGVQQSKSHIPTITKNGRKTLDLTDDQVKVINDKLSEFLLHYINRNKEQFLSEYIRFIGETEYSDDKFNDYIVNYFLAYNTFDQLFEGDVKFYKDPIDFVKRTKEYQGSGVGYAIKDNRRLDLEDARAIQSSVLHGRTFKRVEVDKDGNIVSSNEHYTVEQRTKFRAITVKNSIMPNNKVAEILAKQLKKQNLSPERIETLVLPFKKNTKVNDAQSYITLDEWVRRIAARGQFNQYKDLIEALYDETKPIAPNQFDQFVQIQKNFYFDHHVNTTTKVRAPRQIKNAELVLVPRFIRGTELEQVAKALNQLEIDQLNTRETSKAGNTNVLELWDVATGYLTEEKLNNFINNAKNVSELFDYSYLYTQQETHQHVNTTNKVGIQSAKKIIDNIPATNSALHDAKIKFTENYYGNIIESAKDLFKSLNIPVDEEGNIKIADDNTIKGLNYKEYFRRLQDEARRQELDSNMLDYITLVEDSIDEVINQDNQFGAPTKMPMIMSNVVVKLESLAQSIFNNSITRQKFPGYHSPQTTGVGWRQYTKGDNTIIGASEVGKRLEYHKDGSSTAQIMIPKSCFNFDRYIYKILNGKKIVEREKTDEELIQELKDAGLDKHIIYRIPTEGKQSMCIAEVVGFIDDSYGSTIVVPDDWVTQTGSDFDVDTIYAMTYHSFIDKDGHIQKYVDTTDEDKLYERYVRKNLRKEDTERYVKANKEARRPIEERLKELKDYRTSALENYNKVKQANGSKEVLKSIANTVNMYTEEFRKVRAELDAVTVPYSRIAQEVTYLVDRETYSELPLINKQNKESRDNNMLDAMIEILSNPAVLEENISTSHFDDISENNENIASPLEKKLRKNRSPYNIIDNARFQAELMSGRGLKGISVVLDNMTSVCNQSKAQFGDKGVKIAYNLLKDDTNLSTDEHIKKHGRGYNKKILTDAFGKVEQYESSESVVIEHKSIGHSKNNRNVIGNVITIDTSETTAYFLDIAKEGALENVNIQTVGVFKLFPMIGSDYNVALSFMKQPGISKIVQAQIENDSIYLQGDHNPIHTAIKRLAQEILPDEEINDFTPINQVVSTIVQNVPQNILNQILKLDIKDSSPVGYEEMLTGDLGYDIVIDPVRLRNRINEKGEFAISPISELTNEQYNAIFDLGTVLQYIYLKDLSDAISNYAAVLSPDSFGAKADIFSTNKVFDDIYDILDLGENKILGRVQNADGTETVTNLLQAVYPHIADSVITFDNGDELINREESIAAFLKTEAHNESSYIALYGFLRNVTAASVVVNKMLFPTQFTDFKSLFESVKQKFTYGRRMSAETAKDIEKYLINRIASRSPLLRYPITYNVQEGVLTGLNIDKSEEDNLIHNEQQRIFGYGYAPDLGLTQEYSYDENSTEKVKVQFDCDVTNITQDDIDAFATLTPAQKITYIRKKFNDPLIFKYIRPNMQHFGSSRNVGRHSLSFDEENLSKEAEYKLFNDAFFNSNPLFKLAAMDLIKYAFTVEGYKMSIGATNKVIANNALLNTNGFLSSLVDQIKDEFVKIGTKDLSEYEMDIQRYFQSHPDLTQIVTKTVEKDDKGRWELPIENDDLIITYANKDYGENTDKYMSTLIKYGIVSEQHKGTGYHLNSYVKLKFGKETTLYKIIEGKLYTYLVPLNKFEVNEDPTSDYSVNSKNNVYYKESYYTDFIRNLESEVEVPHYETFKEKYKEHQQYKDDYKFVPKKQEDGTKSPGIINLEQLANDPVEIANHRANGFEKADKLIKERFVGNANPSILYFMNNALASKIWFNGYEGSALYKLDDNGTDKWVIIQKLNPKRYQKYFTDKKKTVSIKREGKELSDLIEEQRKTLNGIENLYKVYLATPNDIADRVNTYDDISENAEASTVGKLGVNLFRGFRVDATEHINERGGIVYQTLKNMGYKLKEESIDENQIPFYKVVASEVKKQSDFLVDKINQFREYDGVLVPISDDRVIEEIKLNPDLLEDFKNTLLGADNLIKDCAEIDEIRIENEIDEIQPYLNSIKESYKNVMDATSRNAAFNNYMVKYLQAKSNNPAFKHDICQITDGFYATSWMERWLADTQEAPNPVVQVIYNQVMTAHSAAIMKGKEEARKFVAEWDRILSQGHVDINKIVDENGNLRPRYREELVNDLTVLKNKRNEAKEQFGEHSIEYLDADIKYQEFLLENVEQPLVDSYYQKYITAKKSINNPRFKRIYETYTKIELDEREYRRNHSSKDADYFNKLAEFKTRKQNLYSSMINGHVKYSRQDPNAFENDEEKELYSKESAEVLKQYIEGMNGLRGYYENEALATFENMLNKHLAVINEFEMYHVNSSREERAAALATNEEYRKSREWIDENTRPAFKKEIEQRLAKARKILSNGPHGSFSKVMESYYSMINDPSNNVQRIDGRVDPDSIPEHIIDYLRDAMNEIYKNSVESQYNDRLLINNASANKTQEIYTADFYEGLRNKSNNDVEQRKKWAETVSKINEITVSYWDTINSRIKTWEIDIDTMRTLGDLMEELRSIKHNGTQEKNEDLVKFYADNVDEETNTAEFNFQEAQAKAKGKEFYKEWIRFNGEPLYNRKGKIKRKADGSIRYTANSYLYSVIKPKHDTIVGTNKPTRNKRKQNAIALVNSLTNREYTPAYRNKLRELLQPGREQEYKDWYAKNHVFNPYTHSMEALPCWTHNVYKPVVVNENGTFETDLFYKPENFGPSFAQSQRKIKEVYKNKNYQEGLGLYYNYKKRDRIAEQGTTDMPENGTVNHNNPQYDTNIVLNDQEKAIRDLMIKYTKDLSKTYSSSKFFGKGHLPYKAKHETNLLKNIANEAKNLIGWINVNANGRRWLDDEEIDYSTHTNNPMPYTEMLASNLIKPVRLQTEVGEEGDIAYNKRVEEWAKERKEQHQKLLDRDYRAVISDFIVKAYRYNAIIENQSNIFMAKKALESYEVYTRSSVTNKLSRDYNLGDDANPVYKKHKDTKAAEQFNTFIRRLVYDIWKEDHGVATKLAQVFQTGTSTKFMFGNVWGGIANVTVGEVGIVTEANARKHFGWKHWSDGNIDYARGVPDYLSHYITGNYNTKEGHLIDLLNVLEYDEIRGVVNAEMDSFTVLKKIRNFGFTPQTSGEHAMQNRVMFAMMESHRLVPKIKQFTDDCALEAMSEEDYILECYDKALASILSLERMEQYNNMIKDIKKDAAKLIDYAEFRKNFVSEFLIHEGTAEERKAFSKTRKTLEDDARKEFNNYPKLFDSYVLNSDNQLVIADDSPLRQLQGDEPLIVLAKFAEKVKSVNKKIHGVYDRLGQASFEKTLVGSCVMQYHKHIYPGIMKRYRRRGMFNESRNSVEKGWNTSLYDFLSIPFDKTGDIFNNDERNILQSIQVLFANILDFTTNVGIYYNILPAYDQENIRRWIADWSGLVASLCASAGIRLAIDDNDDDKARLRGMLLYEADRLNTESFMWNPYGLAVEFKTLYSSPIAAQTTISDLFYSMNLFINYLTDDEFEPVYKTGIHAGENKFLMRLERNIPLWRIYDRWQSFDKSNKYFRLGDSGFGMKTVKNSIDGK